MLAHRQPGDAVWVHRLTTSEVYLCYVPHPDALTSLNVDESKPFPSGRFWLLFAGNPGRLPATMNPQLERARAVARLQQSFTTRGGAAFLFEHD
jgi:hypothetical protein